MKPAGAGGGRAGERVYALLQRAYPAEFRAEYGAEMLGVFRAARRRAGAVGGVGVARFWGAILVDLVVSAARERVAVLRDGLRRGADRRVDPYRPPAGAARPTVAVAADRPFDGATPLGAGPCRPPYGAAAAAALAVLALYVVTLAPTAAFWDAGEYITVAHILGIPHPPGNPLFVVLARAWELLLAPTGLSVAVRINLFSATMGALAHGFWFLVADRVLAAWTADRRVRRIGAAAAVLISATAFTVWNQSNVNEKVYTVSLLTVALVSWLALRWRDTGRRPQPVLLMVYLVALSATNHLMGVLVAPALVVFLLLEGWARAERAFTRAPASAAGRWLRRLAALSRGGTASSEPSGRRSRAPVARGRAESGGGLLHPRLWLAAGGLAALALSAQFFLPVRAAQRPLVSEGAPTCESIAEAMGSIYTWGGTGCDALSSVLRREQYRKPRITLDPTVYPARETPRGAGLLAAQGLNYLQYFDWQWARSVAGADPLFGGIRPILTLLFLALGALGARAHWRRDRTGAAYFGTLFLTLSIGLVLYLNFEYGFSIGRDRIPDMAMHEVRERDYFFLIGFSVWGVWAGLGLTALWQALWQALARRLGGRVRRPRLVAAPILSLALLPLALNWGWASRAEDYTARDWAYNVLMSVEPYGVLFTNGDNDSFPLWYLQKVEHIREDVTIVLAPYLRTAWYVKQLRALTTPCPPGVRAGEDPTRILCQRPFRPESLPPALVATGMDASVQPPKDSIIPLTDAQIERIAATAFITDEPLELRAGDVRAAIPAGTRLLPADSFAAAILQATMGERPIHFMTASPIATRLGLFDYTVRQGLTWRIHDGPVRAGPDTGIVRLPRDAAAGATGAYIDLPRTDTLMDEVFLRRGRILDPDAPWVDAATTSIPLQYVYAHYAAARGHARRGEDAEAERHARRAEWWTRLAGA